jgi:hypothetical protein
VSDRHCHHMSSEHCSSTSGLCRLSSYLCSRISVARCFCLKSTNSYSICCVILHPYVPCYYVLNREYSQVRNLAGQISVL